MSKTFHHVLMENGVNNKGKQTKTVATGVCHSAG